MAKAGDGDSASGLRGKECTVASPYRSEYRLLAQALAD